MADDQAFVRALRDRKLDRLAEVHCRRLLAEEGLDDFRKAELVGMLAQIEIDRAIASAPADREAGWRAADDQIDRFLTGQPDRPAWVLLRLQKAIGTLARGEIEQLEAISQSRDASAATASLRLAARRFEEVAEEIERRRQTAPPLANAKTSFSQQQWASLANRVAIKQAHTLRRLAACHPTGSADRDDALLRSSNSARRLAGLPLPPELLWRARLTLLACDRLLGKPEQALQKLDAWGWTAPPPPNELTAEFVAERWRLLRLTGQQDRAHSWLQATNQSVRQSPEVRVALLEQFMEQRQEAPPSQRSALDQKIQQTIADIRSRHGAVWALRAEAIAGEALATPGDDGSIEAIIASADYLFRSGRFEQAVDAYDRAAAIAYRQGARGRAFELSLTAAAILQSRQQWQSAAGRYRRAALANANHPDAPTAHRTAAVCWSQALKTSNPSNANESWEAYFELLSEHLTTWPQAPSAAEARWWLIQPLAARSQWRRLIPLLQSVPPDDPRHDQAVRLLCEAWTARLEQTAAANDPIRLRGDLTTAVGQLQPVITGQDNRWPASWSHPQREVASTLARIRLAHGAGQQDTAYVRKLLGAAMRGDPLAKAVWKRQAAALLAAAAVRDGDFEVANDIARLATPNEQEQAKVLLDELLSTLRQKGGKQQQAGQLMLLVLGAIPTQTDDAWRLPYRAAALEATGRSEEALQAARRMADNPSDAEAQARLARLLAGRPTKAERQEALALWRKIEDRSRPGAEPWFRARLARTQLMMSLGQRDQASKLVKLTRVLYPSLGGLAQEFEKATNP